MRQSRGRSWEALRWEEEKRSKRNIRERGGEEQRKTRSTDLFVREQNKATGRISGWCCIKS